MRDITEYAKNIPEMKKWTEEGWRVLHCSPEGALVLKKHNLID